MQSPALKELLAPLLRTQRIVHAAFLGSLVVYTAVAFFLTAEAGNEPRALSEVTQLVLTALAITNLAAWLVLRRYFFSDGQLIKVLIDDQPHDALAAAESLGAIEGDRLTRLRELSDRDRKLLRIGQWSLSRYIVLWAIGESVAIFGLVLAFLGGRFELLVPFVVTSAILLLLSRPVVEELLARTMRLAYSTDAGSVTA